MKKKNRDRPQLRFPRASEFALLALSCGHNYKPLAMCQQFFYIFFRNFLSAAFAGFILEA